MKTLTSSVAGIAMLFGVAAQDAQAQDVQIDLNFGGLNLRLGTGNNQNCSGGYCPPPPGYENPCSGGYCPPAHETRKPRKRHSSEDNVICWNLPSQDRHGSTPRVCSDGYDSRYN